MTEWTKFLQKNKGKGYTIEQLSKRYCREKLSQKIAINMREDRYVSQAQAIAVAYSQTRKKFPECKKYLSKTK